VVIFVVLLGWAVMTLTSRLAEQAPATKTPQQLTAVVEVRTAPVDLCWSGAFGGRTVDGCGDTTVPVDTPVPGFYSANAQNQGDSGTLTLILKINGKQIDSSTTTAAYGIASVTGSSEDAK
jgi:hypothetical protein